MSILLRLAVLTSAAIVAACAASSPTPSLSSPEPSVAIATVSPTASAAVATAAATPAPTAHQPFRSTLYGYTVASTDWTGTAAAITWDGTGSPGDADPFVDTLSGPTKARAWAYGEPTTATLAKFAAASRATNVTVHQCPVKPESTTKTTVGGAPALLDAMHCPPAGGVFSLTAFVVRAGRAYVIFTYDQPENETAVRAGFASLLKAVSFAP